MRGSRFPLLVCALLPACGSGRATSQDASVALDAGSPEATREDSSVEASAPCLDGMRCQAVSFGGETDVSCECQAGQWQCPLWPSATPAPALILPAGDPSDGIRNCPAAHGYLALTNLACSLPDRCGTLCVCEGSAANWECETMAVDDAGQPIVNGGIVELSDAGPTLSADGSCPWPACSLTPADGAVQPCADAGSSCITVLCQPQVCGVGGLAFFPFACVTQM